MQIPSTWNASDPTLVDWLAQHRVAALKTYQADRSLIQEHANQEDSFRTGGYAERQLLELVQNSADALHRVAAPGRVELHISNGSLYCANEGEAFTEAGLRAVCHAYLSPRRGDEIGRFGLGFKSVLGVTSTPAVFSRSISFGFAEDWSREDLQDLVPDLPQYPVLRLPRLLDVAKARENDPLLDELATWAQTVVRLPLHSDSTERLTKEWNEFPDEFLLFVPAVSELRLRYDGPGDGSDIIRTCVLRDDGARVLSTGDGESQAWRVWHRTHRPSEEALAEVGEAIRREEIQVSWAAPLDDTTSLGEFWAYFPLKDRTSTRGIINAPWRVSDDRTSLLWGQFNKELCDVAAELVVEGLSSLTSADDPARHFDYLPAREREAAGDADRRLISVIPELAAQTACVPDAAGRLHRPAELLFPHFELRLEVATIRAWHESPGRPASAPHWSCYRNPTRTARLRTLLRRDDTRAAETELGGAAWLEQLVPDGTDEQCASALKVLATVTNDLTRQDLRAARVLPDTDGVLHGTDANHEMFVGGDRTSSAVGLSLVRGSLLLHEGVEEELKQLHFQDVKPGDELTRLARLASSAWGDEQWRGFWGLVGKVTTTETLAVLQEHLRLDGLIKVLSADSEWRPLQDMVMPGLVHPLDPCLMLDMAFHEDHGRLLEQLGAPAQPRVVVIGEKDALWQKYLNVLRENYLADLPPAGRPPAAALNFRGATTFGPLHVLCRFADTDDTTSQAAWTRALLELDSPDLVPFGHVNEQRFARKQVEAPHLWAVRRHGLLASSWGARSATATLGPGAFHHADLLPVSLWPATARLGLVEDLQGVPVDIWREFLERVPAAPVDPRHLGSLLAMALTAVTYRPVMIPAIVGNRPCLADFADVLVARTSDELQALGSATSVLPYVGILCDEDAEQLEMAGLTPATASLWVEIVPTDPQEPVILLDRYRGLQPLHTSELDGVEIVQCADLSRQVTTPHGIDLTPVDIALSDRTVYYVATVTEEDLLGELAGLFRLRMDTIAIARVLNDAQDEQVQLRRARCRTERDPARKLLTLLPVATLETKLPTGLLETVRSLGSEQDERDEDLRIAELLLTVHGFDTLRQLHHELESVVTDVPGSAGWAGSGPAVAFVRGLGFPGEYAGDRTRGLKPDITVAGPPNLPPLHDYQVVLATQIRELIRKPQRAILSLPTGAGKTRVSVEALVRAFLDDGLTGPVLWIAQSTELCEQAVQTWSTVWRQFGDDRSMRIGRLWSRNEVAASEEEVFVVVATDAKLAGCRISNEYEWLASPSVIVIDEAHESTGKEYTGILKWLGLDPRTTSRPLLGLTATPFKGVTAERNKTLRDRFGERLLDNSLGDDPYGELQRRGVLSHVEHGLLDGVDVEMSAVEAAYASDKNLVPTTVLERIGRNGDRTGRLLASILGLDPTWQVLVFTPDVLSAQVLAALLRVKGVKAAAVSGMTRTNERRRSIEQFNREEIQVLTNCNVLTQGFDAPNVRALYIARPTFSPNAYIQMVGRGLRGKENGGTDECLIVNVQDTFGQFGTKLAYEEFDHTWERRTPVLS